MVDPVSAARFDAEAGLDDWRFLLGRIEAVFVANSFATAAISLGDPVRPISRGWKAST